jgi:hypothetical protein
VRVVNWANCWTLRERAPSGIVHPAYVHYGLDRKEHRMAAPVEQFFQSLRPSSEPLALSSSIALTLCERI